MNPTTPLPTRSSPRTRSHKFRRARIGDQIDVRFNDERPDDLGSAVIVDKIDEGEWGYFDVLFDKHVDVPGAGVVRVPAATFDNYSERARRREYGRKGGRPKKGRNRVNVTLRLERDDWQELAAAAACGLIPSREHVMNELLHQYVEQLRAVQQSLDAPNDVRASA